MKIMKKFLAILLALAMILSLAACGGAPADNEATEPAGNEGGNASSNAIRLVNGKIEIDAQLKKLAEMYKAETGVEVIIESMGGGIDIMGTLKGYYQAGNMPEIFVTGSDYEISTWGEAGVLADLTGEAWVSDTDAAFVHPEYGTVGFPYTVEAIGLIANMDLLAKAGVDPATMTNLEGYKAAFEALDAKKDELGLTAVIGYSAEPVNLWWSTGNHMFGNYLDAGLAPTDTTYIDMLSDGGKLDEARLTDFANLFDLFHQYSDPALLVSGTYDQQILNFASGKYAFVTQGNWIGASLSTSEEYAAAGSFECAMIPYAFNDSADTILVNSPSWWAVYDGPNVEAAKAFLQWCSEAAAQEVLVLEAGFISPFKSCTIAANDPLAATVMDYMARGKTSGWHWLQLVEGLSLNYTGQIFADFAGGNLDVEGFVKAMQTVCATAYAG